MLSQLLLIISYRVTYECRDYAGVVDRRTQRPLFGGKADRSGSSQIGEGGLLSQQALVSHLEETKGQVSRLEKISEIVDKKLTGKTCVGMKGVLEEGSEVLEDTEKGTVRDAALIAASQRVEHYEMAGYGSAREFAKLLGHSDIAALLDETLTEEKNADKKLSVISKQINADAKQVT